MTKKPSGGSTARFASIMFLNGACIMVLEMVGARLLTPFLGNSIIVWTSLIGIILASLSIGYWQGGRLADRTLSEKVLAWLLVAAAGAVLLTAAIYGPVLRAIAHLESLHTAAVLTAIVLFTLPAVFCGMVSPYATRLALSELKTAGAVVGTLNAISTAGSILGTFLGGFVLVSWVSSPVIVYGIAAVLGVTALLAHSPVRGKQVLAFLILAGLSGTVHVLVPDEREGIVYVQETPYNVVRIREEFRPSREGAPRAVRVLLTDEDKTQSATFVDNPAELVFEYTKYYALGTYLKPKAERILMLGGGGYSVPKWLLSENSPLPAGSFNLDVVELDPGVTEAAELYLGLEAERHPNMRIVHEDARRFVNRVAEGKGERYDLILGDVFNSQASVPFHVGTVEAARSIRESLAEDGVFLMNIISAIDGDNGRLFRGIHAAFAEVFPHTQTFLVYHPQRPYVPQNIILIAAAKPIGLPDAASAPPEIAGFLANRYVHPIPDDIPALTDAYAPVDRYTLGMIR